MSQHPKAEKCFSDELAPLRDRAVNRPRECDGHGDYIHYCTALHTQEKGLEAKRLVGNVLCSPLFYSTKTETTSSSISSRSGHVIKPEHAVEEAKRPFYLITWDLAMLSAHYIQKGLLFTKPSAADEQEGFIDTLLNRLKLSLSTALVHFYPLSGRLVTKTNESPPSCLIYVDYDNSPGAKFIQAALDMTISEILSPIDVPLVVQSFFDHDRALNYDGHTMPLLSIQITKLIDGIFVGCSKNHCIVDGTSYWHFFNSWSEIFQAEGNDISLAHPPIHKRWFPDGCGPIINLPFTHQDEIISRFEAPALRERVFHFSSESIAKLKVEENNGFRASTQREVAPVARILEPYN
jgi:hypothetical protein